jgi:tetratricopeptide (TPR) repeat protein
MKHHWLWDRTERLFSKAERLLRHGRFEDALVCFDDAILTDPQYPHLHLYKAVALGELGRFEEALASCEVAERLDPLNFVFPMYHATILLDQGDAQRAYTSLGRALALEPANVAVAGYRLLAEWDLGREAALLELRKMIREIPLSLRSRVAVRVERGGCWDTLRLHAADAESSRRRWVTLPAWVRAWLERTGKAWVQRRLKKAHRLIDAKRYETAVRVLGDIHSSNADVRNDSAVAFAAAMEGMCETLRGRLGKLEGASRKTGVPGRTRRDQRRAKQRRELLLQYGLCLAETPQREKAYGTLEKWMREYRAAGSSKNEQIGAGTALVQMAEIDLGRNRYDSASRCCREARVLHANQDPRIDLVEARTECFLDNRLVARRLFESYLKKDLFYLERRIDAELAR